MRKAYTSLFLTIFYKQIFSSEVSFKMCHLSYKDKVRRPLNVGYVAFQ